MRITLMDCAVENIRYGLRSSADQGNNSSISSYKSYMSWIHENKKNATLKTDLFFWVDIYNNKNKDSFW